MSKPKETFLDSKTLFALALLFLAWWGWDFYMKKKYPERFKKASPSVVKTEFEPEKPLEKRARNPLPPDKKRPEKEFWFKGDKMEILFSSRGLGIKRIKLKNYFDRKQEPVQFIPEESALFSTAFFDQEVPFNIERRGNHFIGLFSSAHGRIKKRIEILEKDFALKVQTEVIPSQEKGFDGLSLSFSHPLSQEKSSGFLKMFFIYGMDVLKAFLLYEGKESKRLLGKDLLSCQSFRQGFCESFSQREKTQQEIPIYRNAELVALGGKYFGKAFINKSSLLPSVQLSKENRRAKVFIKYDFLHSKKQNLEYTIFLGPKALKSLEGLGGGLRQWLDFGFFSWMARPLLLFLMELYALCHNWGLAIILLTFVIRLALLPINIKSYKSMKIMQKLQPEMKKIRETYKSDPKKMNQEVMA